MATEPCQGIERHLSALEVELLFACEGLISEFDKFTRYGSPIARAANEPLKAARIAIRKARGE